MNTNQNPEQDPLQGVLREWVVTNPLPPRFQEQVWHRIERAQTRREPTLWDALGRLMNDFLPQPKIAAAYLSIFLALGMGAGAWASQARSSRLYSELSTRYVQSVDPYLARVTQP